MFVEEFALRFLFPLSLLLARLPIYPLFVPLVFQKLVHSRCQSLFYHTATQVALQIIYQIAFQQIPHLGGGPRQEGQNAKAEVRKIEEIDSAHAKVSPEKSENHHDGKYLRSPSTCPGWALQKLWVAVLGGQATLMALCSQQQQVAAEAGSAVGQEQRHWHPGSRATVTVAAAPPAAQQDGILPLGPVVQRPQLAWEVRRRWWAQVVVAAAVQQLH